MSRKTVAISGLIAAASTGVAAWLLLRPLGSGLAWRAAVFASVVVALATCAVAARSLPQSTLRRPVLLLDFASALALALTHRSSSFPAVAFVGGLAILLATGTWLVAGTATWSKAAGWGLLFLALLLMLTPVAMFLVVAGGVGGI